MLLYFAAVLVGARGSGSAPGPITLLNVNTDWALNQLGEFLRLLEYKDRPGMYAATYVGTEDEIAAQKVVVDRVWSKVLGPRPVIPISGCNPHRFDREWTIRCIETIQRDAEIRGVHPERALPPDW